jgi:hypothetical protein
MDELSSEVALLDVDRAFDHVLAGGRRNGLVRPSLVLAAVVAVAMVGWIIAGGPMQSDTPPPPANQPKSATIGAGLPGPATMRLPAGWEVAHDGRYVELKPNDGSAARLVITIPYEVYDPPAYDRTSIQEDLLLWLLRHPAIESANRQGIYQYEDPKGIRPWSGNTIDLSLAAGRSEQSSVPILPLAGIGRGVPLAITNRDATFRLAEVSLEGSRPIAFAAISSTADDQRALDALSELLQSIHHPDAR